MVNPRFHIKLTAALYLLDLVKVQPLKVILQTSLGSLNQHQLVGCALFSSIFCSATNFILNLCVSGWFSLLLY